MKVKFKSIIRYILLVIPSILSLSLVWTSWIDGWLYDCSDTIPLVNFLPPFVHPYRGTNPNVIPINTDHYIYPEAVVWTVWVIFLIAMFALPYLLMKRVFGIKRWKIRSLKT